MTANETQSPVGSRAVQQAVSARVPCGFVQVLDTVDSTNTWMLKARANTAGTWHRSICVADSQRAGRGRRGGSWETRDLDDVVLSLGWRSRLAMSELSGLSLLMGMASVDALGGLGVHAVKVKWPNDLVVSHRKLAGILIETSAADQSEASTASTDIVIGIGMNRSSLAADPDPNREQRNARVAVGDLVTPCPSRHDIVVALACEMLLAAEKFEQQRFGSFSEKFIEYDALYGRAVQARGHDGVIAGLAHGVSENGELVLKREDGRLHEVNAGEVTLGTGYSTGAE